MSELRKFATLLAAGTAGSTPLVLDLRKAADGRLAGSADWTPVLGDTTVSIDGGTPANILTVPAYLNGCWCLVLTAAELTGKSILVKIADQDGPVIADTLVEVQTFGNAAACYPDLYSTQLLPSALVTGKMDSIAVVATDGISAGSLSPTATQEIVAGVWDEPKAAHVTPDTYGAYLDTEVSGLVTGGVSAAEIADAVFAYLVETGLTFQHFCQDMEAMLAGKVLGAQTGTEQFRNHADTKNRVVMTTDENGNRAPVHNYD